MSYVMVSADFPEISPKQRQKIYARLEKENWTKVIEQGIGAVWYASFVSNVSEETAKIIAWTEFEACAVPFCVPKLSVHWGPHKPSFYN